MNDLGNHSAMWIFGGAGDDELAGGDLADLLYGGPGDDGLVGRAGNDTIYGEEGEDELEGHGGNDEDFDPSGWDDVENDPAITVRPGAGDEGSDRITLIWNDDVPQNNWLQVIVDPDCTFLSQPDVFYFGNAVADTGYGNNDDEVALIRASVGSEDWGLLRDSFGQSVQIWHRADYDRDGQVGLLDWGTLRDFYGQFSLWGLTAPQPDVEITGFDAVEEQLSISYTIHNLDLGPFEIGIYASLDGETPGTLLMTHPVTEPTDLQRTEAPEFHTVTFPATFADPAYDYALMAVVDSSELIDEGTTGETNNTAPFSGGIITTDNDGQNPYTVCVYGTAGDDDVDVSYLTALDEYHVVFNTNQFVIDTPTDVAAFHIRTHDGADQINQAVTSGEESTVPLLVYGGPGDDLITGGNAADLLYGGLGNDNLTGGDGDDVLDGGKGMDTLDGEPETNTPPAVTGGIDDVHVAPDAASTLIDLWPAFEDAQDLDSEMDFIVTVIDNNNPALFESVDVDLLTGVLTLDHTTDGWGMADLTVEATDSLGLTVATSFEVWVGDYVYVELGEMTQCDTISTVYGDGLTPRSFYIPIGEWLADDDAWIAAIESRMSPEGYTYVERSGEVLTYAYPDPTPEGHAGWGDYEFGTKDYFVSTYSGNDLDNYAASLAGDTKLLVLEDTDDNDYDDFYWIVSQQPVVVDLDIWDGQYTLPNSYGIGGSRTLREGAGDGHEEFNPQTKQGGAFTVVNINDTDGDGRRDDQDAFIRSFTTPITAGGGNDDLDYVVVQDTAGFYVNDWVTVGTAASPPTPDSYVRAKITAVDGANKKLTFDRVISATIRNGQGATVSHSGRDEIDMMRLVIQHPRVALPGNAVISVLAGSVKLWYTQSKIDGSGQSSEATLDANGRLAIPVASIPPPDPQQNLPGGLTLWVEVLQASATVGDIRIGLTFDQVANVFDEVHATGIWVGDPTTLTKRTDAIWQDLLNKPVAPNEPDLANNIQTFGGFGPLPPFAIPQTTRTRFAQGIGFEYTVMPLNIERQDAVMFDITRSLETRTWQLVNQTWQVDSSGVKALPRAREEPNDDGPRMTVFQDETIIPTASRHLYSYDIPRLQPASDQPANEQGVIQQTKFFEWVRVGFGSVNTNPSPRPDGHGVLGSRTSTFYKWASRTQVLRNADLTWYRPGGLIESNENQIVVGQHLPFTDPNQQP